jgi:hypothetical protein
MKDFVPPVQFTQSQKEFLEKHVRGKTFADLTVLFNKHFKTVFSVNKITGFCGANGLRNGLPAGGQRPGISKKDGMPQEIGSEVIHKCTCRGKRREVVYIKVSNKGHSRSPGNAGTWKRKNVYVWEQAYGKVPRGYNVIFLDGDKHNFQLENLAIATVTEIRLLSKYELWFNNIEATKTGLAVVRHRLATVDAINRLTGDKRRCDADTKYRRFHSRKRIFRKVAKKGGENHEKIGKKPTCR